MTTPDPIRAALERLVDELNRYDPKFDAFPDDALAAARAALDAALEGEANVGSEIWREAVANSDSDDECRSFQRGAEWALSRWGRPATPPTPAAGEVVAWLVVSEMVRQLRTKAATEKANRCHYSAALLTRAADLLQQDQGSVKSAPSLTIAPAPAVVPVAVSKALINAECALADVAEGERWCDEGDLLQWAERRCAKALANIRPVMKQHQIRTSEWPPLPAPQGGEVEA